KLLPGIGGTRVASALAAGAVALIRSRYPAMPWYQVIQRLVGTALPAGGRVPNDSFGYGIFRLSQAVNATAYPVPAGAPNPVYAKYRAWLATPQGRAVSGRLAPPSVSAAPSRPAKGGSAALPLAAVMGLLAAAGAGTAAVIARGRRRPVSRRPGPARMPFPDAVPGPGAYVP